MSQVKKYDSGTGVGGVQPTAPATTATPQITFKVNGSNYTTDEQGVRDMFDSAFNTAKQRKLATEGDRDKWRAANEQFVNQAKQGTYELNSSNGHWYGGDYKGAPGSNVGLNSDGSTAQKTKIGRIISKNESSDPSKIMASLNPLLGEHIINNFTAQQQKSKADADVQAAKAKSAGLTNAETLWNKYQTDFGTSNYGKASPTLASANWNSKLTPESMRMSRLGGNYSDRISALFNPALDAHKDELKARGIDIDAERAKWKDSGYLDADNHLAFKPTARTDFSDLARLGGTMDRDMPFIDPSILGRTAEPTQEGGQQGTQLKGEGKYFTDGKALYEDPAGAKPINGLHNGVLYDQSGKLYNGPWVDPGVPSGTAATGSSIGVNYGSQTSGDYLNGKKVDRQQYVNYYNSVKADPSRGEELNALHLRQQNVDNAFHITHDMNAYIPYHELTNNDQSGNPFVNDPHPPAAVANITKSFTGLDPNKAEIVQGYRDDHRDEFGHPVTEHYITLANGQRFTGSLNQDPVTHKFQLTDKNGQVNTDPHLNSVLQTIKDGNGQISRDDMKDVRWAPNGINTTTGTDADNTGGKAYSLSNYSPMDWLNLKPLGDYLNTNPNTGVVKRDPADVNTYRGSVGSWKDGGKIPMFQGGGAQFGMNVKGGSPEPDRANSQTAKVGDIVQGLNPNSSYKLSKLDKWELAGLGSDLASTALSLTGAGSIAGAAAGAAGTTIQVGTDIARGDSVGDVLKDGAIGYGLDAITAIPGLGLEGKEFKFARTLARTSKILIPAMAGMGLLRGAGVVSDLVSGKKSLSDLNVDDLRELTQGVQGVLGLGHFATQMAGTTKADVLTLKDGTKVPLSPSEASGITNAETPDAKIQLAKQIAASKLNKGVDEIELPTGKQLNLTLNLRKALTTVEKPKVSEGATILRDPSNYQGDGLWDKFMRGSIDRTALRNPWLAPGDANQQWGVIGDYTRSRYGLPTNDATTSTVQSNPSNDTPLKMLTNLPNLATAGGLNPTPLIFRATPNRDMFVKFKKGGVVKRYQGGNNIVPFLPDDSTGGVFDADPYSYAQNLSKSTPTPSQKNSQFNTFVAPTWQNQGRASSSTTPSQTQFKSDSMFSPPTWQNKGIAGAVNTNAGSSPYSGKTWQPGGGLINSASPSSNLGDTTQLGSNTSPYTSVGGGNNSLTGNYRDYTPFSELGRALYTRAINSQIDTRVERPMTQAPTEVPISVRGNLYAENQANAQADNIVRNAAIPRTSDASLNAIMNLQANSNAQQVRMQGVNANIDMLNKTRDAATQSAVLNTQARTNAANANVLTNSRATQAEREANNEKLAKMNQPIVDYWQHMDDQQGIYNQRNRGAAVGIGQSSEEAKVSNVTFNMQQQMNNLDNQMSKLKPGDPQYDTLQQQYMNLNRNYGIVMNKLKQAEIRQQADPNYQTPYGYYNLSSTSTGFIPTQAGGGQLRADITNSRANYRYSENVANTINRSEQSGVKEENQEGASAMKDVQSLIRMALNGK